MDIKPKNDIKNTVQLNKLVDRSNELLLLKLEQKIIAPIVKSFFDCSNYDALQKLEEVLRKSLATVLACKNIVNKKYLDKEIQFNPELGVVIKKMTEPQAPKNRQIKEGEVPPKPRFNV